MATLAGLASLLRTELGDTGRSFVWQTVADGVTNRYEIPHAPVNGPTLTVLVGGVDVSAACAVEEATGFLTFDVVPTAAASIVVGGTVYRYFTDTDINGFVNTALLQHSNTATDTVGRRVTITSLPAVEEYPVAVLATSLALQALATDAAFDIDISAPDGVMIPRSQRYRQLMEMVEQRKAQYKDLCANLNVGLYRIETFVVRRVSNRTNRLSPVYVPQEIDDRSTPTRVVLPIPNFGSQPLPTTVAEQDHYVYGGDSYSISFDFPMDLTGYNIDAQIRSDYGLLYACFTVDVPDIPAGVVVLSLTGEETDALPKRALWDLQLTDIATGEGVTWMHGYVFNQNDITNPSDPMASGWRG